MAAHQALTADAIDVVESGDYPVHRVDVLVQNLGPNPIYVEVGAEAEVLESIRIPAGADAFVRRAPGQRVSVITTGADQVSPNDTRVLVVP